jgi:hypothetical protein
MRGADARQFRQGADVCLSGDRLAIPFRNLNSMPFVADSKEEKIAIGGIA